MSDTTWITASIDGLRDDLHALYRDLHAHPELSFQEHRTSGLMAERLRAMGLEVTTGMGGTGVVGMLRNGDGPTVLLRADMDGLPVLEDTGLPFASMDRGTDPVGMDVPVMHACGHDVHMTSLIGALALLVAHRDTWSGTVMALFQPAEELGGGAKRMVEDGLFERLGRPDVSLGQHVFPQRAGLVGGTVGPAFSASDVLNVTFHGRGAHGSRPEDAIDPVVMAAAVVMRLQTVVSREIAGSDTAVVTVATLHAGTKANIIPAEAMASGAVQVPTITLGDQFPVLLNDASTTDRVMAAFGSHFAADQVRDPGRVMGSEDFGTLGMGNGISSCYWLIGGTDPTLCDAAAAGGPDAPVIPTNHSPFFAPVMEPTLTLGVSALVVATLAWLGHTS
ncbi:MAG: amidohydrolase [Chloroflexi bacterium]|nr:amidohydrolase [Chloroflexota bacterium]